MCIRDRSTLETYRELPVVKDLQGNFSLIVQGVVPALTPGELGADDPYRVIAKFNLMTDSSIPNSLQKSEGRCEKLKDNWGFTTMGCREKKNIYSGGNPKQDIGNDICIPINVTKKTELLTRYQKDDLEGCQKPATPEDLNAYVNSLYDYFESVKVAFNGMIADLNTVQKRNGEFTDEVKRMMQAVFKFQEEARSLLNVVGDKKTGLLSKMNCRFVLLGFESFHDTFCQRTISNIYPFANYLALTAVVMIFFGFFLYCASMRMANMYDNDEDRHKFKHKDSDMEMSYR
eukprot:TRINITY_DN12993_c0_g1_i1.p1 TRINITY_DN12993_c0_g1~~TRINITY_DN12993_c0_g1_i1.p1  ORF type:complete len:288 (+),score=72.34 TRINITY_DN12993_c0_g1_i1:65-928(+)